VDFNLKLLSFPQSSFLLVEFSLCCLQQDLFSKNMG
jgi:hypothetical protein